MSNKLERLHEDISKKLCEIDAMFTESPKITMSNPKCIRIELEFDDGAVLRLTGAGAQTFAQFADAACGMAEKHGMIYNGPQMKVVQAPKEKP